MRSEIERDKLEQVLSHIESCKRLLQSALGMLEYDRKALKRILEGGEKE